MNSDYLALLNTGSVSNAAVIFGNNNLNSKNVSDSSGLDFAALLADKIKDKENELEAGKKSKEAYAWAVNALASTSLISPAADFLSPVRSIQQAPKVEKLEKPVKEAQNTNASNASSKETEKSAKTNESEKTENTSETENAKKSEEVKEEVSLNTEDTNKLEELLNSLSEEDKETLIADPENFVENLAKIVEAMPDSELKEELSEVMNDEELVNEMQAMLAVQQQQKTVQVTNIDKQSEMSFDDNEQKEDETLTVHTKPKSENTVKTEVQAHKETEDSKVEETDESKVEVSENTEDISSKSDDKKVKADSKVENKSSIPEESLRDEFARIHKLDEEPVQTTVAETAQSDIVPEVITGDMTAIENAAPELKAAAEQLIEKFFASSESVKENIQPSKQFAKTETYNANGQIGIRNLGQTNSSNNSSMNNGFSFQSGHSGSETSSAHKAGNSAPVPHTNFSEMLQKAEMVKTKDGVKILNIEVNQEEFGKLEMELKSKDGAVTANLSAANEEIKNKIEEIAPRIIEQLMSQGVNIAELNVDVSSKQSNKNSEYDLFGMKKSSGKLNKVDFADSLSEAEEEISKIDLLNNLRRAALNIQYVDEIV